MALEDFGIPTGKLKSVDELLESLRLGLYQYRLLVMCGLAFMADAMEVSLLSFLSICAGKEWDLTTSEMATITSTVFVGQILGTLFWGRFADAYGRRRAFIIACVFITSGGFLSGASPTYDVLIFFRFLVGFGVGGLSVPFDLLAEFLPSSHRGKFLLYIELFWTLGSLFVAGIAWVSLSTRGWRFLAYMTAIPVTVSCLISMIYLPESPRWLVEKGREKEAYDIILKVATFNKHKLDVKDVRSSADTSPISTVSDSSATPITPSSNSKEIASENGCSIFLDLVSGPQKWISIPLWVVWMSFGFAYYGVILFVSRVFNETEIHSESCTFNYRSIFINSLSEILGVTLAATMIDGLGRSKSQIILYTGAAVAVLGMGFSQHSFATLSFVAAAARFLAMSSSCVTWVATPELYPTSMRATGHSVCSSLSRVGAFCSPYLVESSLPDSSVGAILFGANLVAAIASSALPETSGRGLDGGEATGIAEDAEIPGGSNSGKRPLLPSRHFKSETPITLRPKSSTNSL